MDGVHWRGKTRESPPTRKKERLPYVFKCVAVAKKPT